MLYRVTVFRQYCIAVLSVIIAFTLRMSLVPLIGTEYPFPLFFFAVIVTSYYGGVGPSLLSIVLGYVVISYFFIEPPYSIVVSTGKGAIVLASYLATSLAIVALCSKLRTYQDQQAKLQEGFEEQNKWLRRLINATPDILFVFDVTDYHLVYSSKEAYSLLGFVPERLIGLGSAILDRIVYPDDLPGVIDFCRGFHSAGDEEVRETESRFLHADGSQRIFQIRGVVFNRWEDGRVREIIGSCRDITEQKRTENVLRASEEEFRTLFDVSENGKVIVDCVTRRYLRVNRKFCELTGYSEAELLGMTFSDLTYLEDRERDYQNYETVRQTGDHFEIEKRYRRKDGSLIWVWVSGSAIRDESGKPQRFFAIVQNISERKQAEKALNEAKETTERSLAQVQAILRHMTEGLVIADPEGHLLEMNQKAMDLLGFDRVEPLRRGMREYEGLFELYTMDEERLPVEQWPLARALRGETFSQLEYRVHRKNHEKTFYGSFGGTPVRDKDGHILFGIFTVSDVTERIQMERSLRESEQQYRAIFENAGVGIGHSGLNGGWLKANPRLCEILGYPPEELLDRTNYDLTHPEDLPIQIAQTERLIRGEIPEISMRKRYIHKSGKLVWVHLTLSLIKDKEGNPLYLLGVAQDISAQVEAEEQLKNLNQNLETMVAERTATLEQQSEKLRRLTVEITHAEQRERQRLAELLHDHLQQILVAAMMRVSRTQNKVDHPELRVLLAETRLALEESIRVSRSLTAELLPPVLRNGGLAAALQWLARTMKKQHNLEVALDLDEDVDLPDEPMRILLFQTVRELLFNIIKHANVNEASLSLTRTREGDIHLSVADAGTGFDLSVVDREQKGEGGFGLFSVRERIQIMGGRVDFQTQPGQGTRVTLTVPRNG